MRFLSATSSNEATPNPSLNPDVCRRACARALVGLAESHIAQRGHHLVVLESSINAVGFYLRLGYAPAGTRCSSVAVAMRKHLDAA
jgi:Acetyltransferase (GNAT) domain